MGPVTLSGSDATAPSSSNTANGEVTKDLFLQLMVAQLRNQNPLNPVDGVDFLMQLSQISGVEQMIHVRQELEEIHKLLQGQASAVEQQGS